MSQPIQAQNSTMCGDLGRKMNEIRGFCMILQGSEIHRSCSQIATWIELEQYTIGDLSTLDTMGTVP